MTTLEAKVVILGSQGVGKTSLIHRYVGHMFTKDTKPTIGASFCSCDVDIEEHKVKLLVWDTAGQERFRSMAPLYYRNANAAILMFDMTSWETYEDMQSWVQELKVNVQDPTIVCVVGNKSDMHHIRAVPSKDAIEFALSIGALYHETSALNCEGVEAVFVDIAHELLQQKLKVVGGGSNYSQRQNIQQGKIIHLANQKRRRKNSDNEERSFLCC